MMMIIDEDEDEHSSTSSQLLVSMMSHIPHIIGEDIKSQMVKPKISLWRYHIIYIFLPICFQF